MNDIKIERLREVINEKGWTQKRIADESGYTQQYISNLLNGTRPITVDSANAIGKVLDIDPDYILGLSEFKSQVDYYFKSIKYHANFESKLLELLDMLNIHISAEPYIIEKIEKRLDINNNLQEISSVVTNRSQAFRVRTPTGEKIFSELELLKMKDELVKSIIETIGI